MQDLPDPDLKLMHKEAQAALAEAMSPLCRQLYDQNPDAVRWEYLDGLSAHNTYGETWLAVGDADVKTVLEPFLERAKAHRKLKEKLENSMRGIRTLKQLQEAFPKLVKYMPEKPGKTANLPAVTGIVEALEALGWPAGKDKEAGKGATA
jgi:hypothetical protein